MVPVHSLPLQPPAGQPGQPTAEPAAEPTVEEWIELHLARLDAELADPTSRTPFQVGPFHFREDDAGIFQFCRAWVVTANGFDVPYISRSEAIESVKRVLPGHLRTQARLDRDLAELRRALA